MTCDQGRDHRVGTAAGCLPARTAVLPGDLAGSR